MKNKRQEVSESDESDADVSHAKNGVKSQDETNVSESEVSSSDSSSDKPAENSKTKPRNEKSSNENEKSNKKRSSKEQSDKVKATFWMEELTPDDELYTFQCPTRYKKHLMENKDLEFSKLNTIVNKKTQEVFQLKVFNSEKSFLTLALPAKKSDGCLVNVALKGHIVVQQDLSMPAVDDNQDDCDTNKVSFPTDIKIRHPLLGVDWQEHINSVNQVLRKSRSAVKKHKKKKRESEAEDSLKSDRRNSESESSPSKKRKKK